MPTTSQLVTNIQRRCSGWTITGSRGILPVLNDVHRYMVARDCENNLAIDSTTGMPPYLDTVEGTVEYELPTNARKLKAVFIEQPSYGDAGISVINEYYNRRSRWDDFFYRGYKYYNVPLTSRPRNRNRNPVLWFRDDPGTQEDYYFLAYYINARDISSVGIQLDIEEQYHMLVEDGVVARIRQVEYGDTAPWMGWQERVMAEYWEEQNSSPSVPNQITLRPF